MSLVKDIRELQSNHQVLLDRRSAAEQAIADSQRKIDALEAALTPEEKRELNPPAEAAPEVHVTFPVNLEV